MAIARFVTGIFSIGLMVPGASSVFGQDYPSRPIRILASEPGGSTVEADFQFHLQLALATGNRYFEEVLRGLGGATIARRNAVQAAAVPIKPQFGETHPLLEHGKLLTLHEHEGIYACVLRGDAAAARAAMFMHLSNSRERKLRIISTADE